MQVDCLGILTCGLSCFRVDAIILMDGDGSEPIVRRGGALKRWMDARDAKTVAEDEVQNNIQIPLRARSVSEDSRAWGGGGGSSRTGSERGGGTQGAAAGSFGTSLAGNAGENGGTSYGGGSGITTPLLGSLNQVDPVGAAGTIMWNAGRAVGDAVGVVGGGVGSVAKVASGGVIGGVAGVWGGAKAVAKGAGKVVKAGGKFVGGGGGGGGKTSPRSGGGDLGRGRSNTPPPFRDMGRERFGANPCSPCTLNPKTRPLETWVANTDAYPPILCNLELAFWIPYLSAAKHVLSAQPLRCQFLSIYQLPNASSCIVGPKP